MTISTISGNAATYADGGGVYSYEAPATITSSTISGNSAVGDGGGIFSEVATMTITASTVSGNSAYYGGGIYSNEGTLNVTNSTISGNQARHHGGGIVQHLGNITVTHSTITANRADSDNNGTGARRRRAQHRYRHRGVSAHDPGLEHPRGQHAERCLRTDRASVQPDWRQHRRDDHQFTGNQIGTAPCRSIPNWAPWPTMVGRR